MKNKGRGCLTQTIKDYSKETLGYEISVTELRLMPYLQYELMNNKFIDSRKINAEEYIILTEWSSRGYIDGVTSTLTITPEFWHFICAVCYMSYVNI